MTYFNVPSHASGACEYCNRGIGHATGCPNAETPERFVLCKKCYEEIQEGTVYYIDEERDVAICEDCLVDMSAEDLCSLLGIESFVHGRDD